MQHLVGGRNSGGLAVAAATAAVAVGGAGGEAREIQFEQLANEHVDIKRWINMSLEALAPTEATAAAAAATTTDTELEARITKLYNRLQSHSQEVAGSVEDTITQALVRLPRTGLEVGRMATEAQQLQQQLQMMQDAVKPAVEAVAKPYLTQLNNLKTTQEKLTRCGDMLRKASQVDNSMKQLDEVMQKLRTAPSEVNMDAVAESISQVRCNLAELQKLEVTLGDKQLEAVERYEQVVQRTVEAECVEKLRRREVERAGQLLKVLDTIGRADVVLQQYATEVMAGEKEQVVRLLQGRGSSTTRITPARAAEVLKDQLMPSIGHTLADQLDYLLCIVQAEDGAPWDALNPDKSSGKHLGAETRAVKMLQLMVGEVGSSIANALGPILERVERNDELVACCDAVRKLKIGVEAGRSKNSSLGEKISRQITTHALSEMTQLFIRPDMLEAFVRREADRVEALLGDSQSIMNRERFRVAMDALIDAVRRIVRFFPEKVLPVCVGKWQETMLDAVAHLQPRSGMSQGELLERLSAARTVVRQLLLSTQKSISDYLTSPELQRVCPGVADAVDNQLRTQLWVPLTEALDACAVECQWAVKRTIVEPVVAKADGYDSQPFWSSKKCEGGGRAIGLTTPVAYTPAQVAPSELVRAFGEAIVEIPLALEALRGDGEARLDGIGELLEEVAEFWLDDIVRTAVANFIEKRVGNITIHFPSDEPGADVGEAAAMEQLVVDLGYLKSILAAVSDDPFDALERTLVRLRAAGPPSGKPIVVRQLVSEGV